MLHQSLRDRSLWKRSVARQHEVERAAEAVDVGPCVNPVAVERLFGGKIVDGADHLLVVGHRQRGLRLVGEPRQPHVENLDRAGLVDQQIGGLDVAVNQSVGVRIGQPLGGLCVYDAAVLYGSGPLRLTIACKSLPLT